MILKSIKYWWKHHKWINTSKNRVFPHSTTIFWLNEIEEKRAQEFKKETGARFYQYCFTPGPIGTCIHIKCRDRNGKYCERDITDYKAW